MLSNILLQLNWVDIIVAFLLFRILYISAKNGFVVELFKVSGIVFTIYITLHYYITLSDFIAGRIPVVPPEFLNFFIFILLAIISYLSFTLLRSIFCNLVKMEAVPMLSKWGGFVLGGLRGILTAGLIIFMLYISTTSPYINTSVKKSYSGRNLFNIAVAVYSGMWNGFMSKFMTFEKINGAVLKIQKNFNK